MSAERQGFSFRPAFQLMGGRILGFVATFFVPVVLARVFAPEAFGTYKQLFLVYTTLYGLAQIGMAESLFYFLPRAPEKGGRYFVNSLLLLGLSGSVAFTALWLGREPIAAWLSNPALARYLPWIGGYLLLMLASAGLEIGLLCRERYLTATAAYALSDALRAAVLIAPALIAGDLRWLLAGAVAFAALRLGVHLTLLARSYGDRLRPDRGLLRSQLRYSLPFQAAVVVEVAQTNLHLYAVSHWFDAATFAVYSVGCLQIPLVELASSSAGNVLMVGMGGALKEGDVGRARTIWRATTRKLGLMLVPATVALLVAGRDLIPFLFTDTYVDAVPIFLVWTSAIALGALQTDAALRTFAEVRLILGINVVRLALIGGLIVGAVSGVGLPGAVAVTVLATAVAKALGLARVRRRLETGWSGLLPWGDLLRISAVSVVAAVPPVLLWPELERGTFATLAILGTVYASGLVALLLAFRVLDDDELAAVGKIFRRVGVSLPLPGPSKTR